MDIQKKLRGLGALGGHFATVITLLTTNWVLVVTTVVGVWASFSEWTTGFLQAPETHAAILVTLAILWTYIGIVVLIDRNKPKVVKSEQSYEYGLTFEGLVPGYEPNNEEAAFQLGLALRNYSNGPIRYNVEHFDVRIGTRSLPKLKKNSLTSIIPKGGNRVSTNLPFKKSDISEFIGKRATGTAEFAIVYGHPEQQPVRRLNMALNLIVLLQENGPPGFNAMIIEESDESFTPTQ